MQHFDQNLFDDRAYATVKDKDSITFRFFDAMAFFQL